MKVTVITGSPHKKGTSALLADKFIAGATEAGHDVYRFYYTMSAQIKAVIDRFHAKNVQLSGNKIMLFI